MTREKSRDRVLSKEEIPTLFKALNARGLWTGTRLALEMILRTAQRPGEIRLMQKDEIDHDKQFWTIPSEKAKNGVVHLIPLTQKMISIIDVAASVSSSDYVFGSPRKLQEPLSIFSMAQAMRKAFADSKMERVTPHDLRRTAATYISEAGFNRLVVDKLLNHVDRTVGGTYDRHDYLKEKRMALEAWERELDSILSDKKSETKVLSIGAEK